MLKDISNGQRLPFKFTGQILSVLCKKNLLKSNRNRSGGYSLKKAASEITLKDIIEAIEGSMSSAEHLENFALWESIPEFPARGITERLLNTIYPILSTTTLQNLLSAQDKLLYEKPGIPQEKTASPGWEGDC